MKHLFIINPAAGKYDHTEEYTKVIKTICEKNGADYEIALSRFAGDCTRIAKEAAETGGEYRIYACGGDGTLNEVLNGIVGFDNVALTHFPGGSGNDTIKMFSETEPFHHLERLLDAEEARLDLIRVNDRYSLNIASMGLDARVAAGVVKYKRLPMVSGHGAYVISLGDSVLKGMSRKFTVSFDGSAPVTKPYTLICISNGRWYGGGFNPTPDAEPDDGLLDVLLVKKVSFARFAALVGDYKKGGYARHPKQIEFRRCKKLTVESEKPSVVNIDGESLFTTKAEFEVLPQKLRFFYPKGLTYRNEN